MDYKQIIVATLLAAIPALIWGGLLFGGRSTSRGPLFLAFFLGTLTVLPIQGLNYLWAIFPQTDIFQTIELKVTEVHLAALLTLALVGILEELTKSGVVRFIDKTRIGIQTINDAVKYSVLAGLGFAFIENILYFTFIWKGLGLAALPGPLIFRSIFTVCGHMVFSGIFGYYFGLAKFAKPIMETKLWMGEKALFTRVMSNILGTNEANAFRQFTLLKGLFIAMSIHLAFNFLLEFEYVWPVMFLIAGGFLYLLYLLARKASAIVFSGLGRPSSMNKKDQEVVMELLGLWSQEGRYQDVIDICQRLLMSDPDNKVVHLFQAQAMDQQKLAHLESTFYSLFSQKDQQDNNTLNALVKQKILVEMLKEKQQMNPSSLLNNPVTPARASSPAVQKTTPSTPSVPTPIPPSH